MNIDGLLEPLVVGIGHDGPEWLADERLGGSAPPGLDIFAGEADLHRVRPDAQEDAVGLDRTGDMDGFPVAVGEIDGVWREGGHAALQPRGSWFGGGRPRGPPCCSERVEKIALPASVGGEGGYLH